MCHLIFLLAAALTLSNTFPIGAEDPVAFTCEVRHQNSTLTPNWQECQDTCKELCDTAGSGARLQACLKALHYLGLGDCIFAFRQTIKLESSNTCVQQVSINPPITKLIFELPAIAESIVPRTSQPKGVQVILETVENLCEASVDESDPLITNFSLEWVPAEWHWGTSEPVHTSSLPPSAASPSATVLKSDATSQLLPNNNSDPATSTFCETLDLVEESGIEITADEIQYAAANRLSLDLLSWGLHTWREVGFHESYLVLKSYNADCTFNTKHLKSASFTLSQFGTIKVAQSSAYALLHCSLMWELSVLVSLYTLMSLS